MASLSRKFLAGIGIDDDKTELIIEKHQEVRTEVKTERDEYKEKAEKLPAVEKELEDLKKATDSGKENSYKVKYEALKEEFETFKKDAEAKETQTKKETAYKHLLKQAGVSDKRIDAVLKVSDLSKLEFDEEGKVKDEDAIIKGIKSEWSDFIVTQGTKGAETATPPSGNSSSTYKSKADIMKIKDTTERQAAWKDYLNGQSAETQKG